MRRTLTALPLFLFRKRIRGIRFSSEGRALLFFLVSIPLLSLLHQAAAFMVACLLQNAGEHRLFESLAIGIGLDPVYSSVLNSTLGNIQVTGLAVAGPIGEEMHLLAGDVFAGPDKVLAGAWVTLLVREGGSVLATTIASIGAESIFVASGLLVVMIALLSFRGRRNVFLALVLLGIVLQARGIIGLVTLTFSAQDLEIMGLAHVFTKLLPMDAGAYRQLVEDPVLAVVAYLVPLAIILGLYSPVIAFALIKCRPWKARDVIISKVSGHTFRMRQAALRNPLLALGLIAAFLFQMAFPDIRNYNYPAQTEPDESSQLAAETPLIGLVPTPTPFISKSGPSKVTIEGSRYNYVYEVNGTKERIHGVGYNVVHFDLATSARISRYNADFYQMREYGINTIIGWNQREFDELTLQKAEEFGLGVAMPWGLLSHVDYADPNETQKIEDEIRDWVKKYRNAPALRMWAIGNEVIHGMGSHPGKRRVRAFARFYVKLADAVHALDPDHPVLYRDAEDVYVAPIREELAKDSVRRPWLAYGVNFFTPRIADALRNWPVNGPDMALVVSEFAPTGLTGDDRPQGYLQMWRPIIQNKSWLLGGFAYVWNVTGPEAIDRVMGLVDDESMPVDGSLKALGRAFRCDTKASDEAQPGDGHGRRKATPLVFSVRAEPVEPRGSPISPGQHRLLG